MALFHRKSNRRRHRNRVQRIQRSAHHLHVQRTRPRRGCIGEQRIAGVYREDITYNNGTQYTCSTSNQSWTATRDEKQGPASFPATEGSYTGTNPQGIGGGDVDFNVSPSGNLQDVVVETTKLGCAPSREFITTSKWRK